MTSLDAGPRAPAPVVRQYLYDKQGVVFVRLVAARFWGLTCICLQWSASFVAMHMCNVATGDAVGLSFVIYALKWHDIDNRKCTATATHLMPWWPTRKLYALIGTNSAFVVYSSVRLMHRTASSPVRHMPPTIPTGLIPTVSATLK